MYRAPTSSGGATGFLMLLFILWGAFYVSGCAETPSDPGFDNLPPVGDVEIELATDPDLIASLLEDVTSVLGNNMTSAAALEISTAEGLFRSARDEWVRGDYERVRVRGDEAREALGRALTRGRDRSTLDDYISRTDHVRQRLDTTDRDDFDRPNDLAADLDRLLADAKRARARGDDVTAGKRVVEASERTDRSRARRHRDAPEEAARWAVSMAASAVDLANRLLEGSDPSERQLHLLDTAMRLAASAAEALENGHFRQALMLGHKAVGMALMAVVSPDGVTEDEIRALIELAEAQLLAANEALQAEPSEALEKVLRRAEAAFTEGVQQVENGNERGIHPIWRAAVVGSVIAG